MNSLRLLLSALVTALLIGSAGSAIFAQEPDAAPLVVPANEKQPEELAESADAVAGDATAAKGVVEAERAKSAADEGKEEPVPHDKVLAKKYRKAMMIDVRGPIFESMKQYMASRLKAAENAGVDLIILRITSPGGELQASLDLARKLSQINWATTIAFVPDDAYSGAAILALGCDRIYMRPKALIGDAGPIRLVGNAFEHVEEKVLSLLAVAVRELAVAKNRPGAIAEAMADRSLVIREARRKDDGGRFFLTSSEAELPANQEKFDIGLAIPESGQNRFLTVPGTRAVELMIAEGTFESEREFLQALQVEQITQTRRTWVDKVVYVFNLPAVSGLLLLIGLIGLYVEFAMPGITVAALVSLSCFALFFWSHALGGTSGWLEVMLFALGISCLAIELFILPGFGVFGLTGGLMVILSLVMASQDFVLPRSSIEWSTLRNNLLIVLGAMASLVVALIIQVMFFDSVPGLGSFRLEAPEPELTPADAASYTLVGGSSLNAYLPQLGATGIADSVLRPAGKVRFGNQLVDVVTEGDFLDPGTNVEVVQREGNRIIVRRMI